MKVDLITLSQRRCAIVREKEVNVLANGTVSNYLGHLIDNKLIL